MIPSPQRSTSKRAHKHKRFPWLLGVLVSIGFIAILAFIIVTLLILQSQGISQGMNTLTIISIVVGFVISVLSLLISFLQWHHSSTGRLARTIPCSTPPSVWQRKPSLSKHLNRFTSARCHKYNESPSLSSQDTPFYRLGRGS